MALGGGAFKTLDKVLPGTYINFIGTKIAERFFSARGIVAVPLALDWGKSGVATIKRADFYAQARSLFGYAAEAPELTPLRELFVHAHTAIVYRINAGGIKASNTLAEARYAGTRGNALTAVVTADVEAATFTVAILLDGRTVFTQKCVTVVADLKENDFVTWKPEATIEATAGLALGGGTNGAAATTESYTDAFGAFESHAFNVLAIPTADAAVVAVAAEYTKRLRDEVGSKFQTVVYNTGAASDYEGVIDVATTTTDANAAALVYWVAGLMAGTPVEQSCTNRVYDGELAPVADYTQVELEEALGSAKFVLHRTGSEIRTLRDINSLITFTAERGAEFSSNQSVRILDEYATAVAALFARKYIGAIPNDEAARQSLWSDIVSIKQELRQRRAIEDFDSEAIVVTAGADKKSVIVTDAITPLNAMEQLYMTVVVA